VTPELRRFRVRLERSVNECRSSVVEAHGTAEARNVALTSNFDEDLLDDWVQMDPGEPRVYDVAEVGPNEPLTPIIRS
jgi:hypothetical protein